MDNYCKTCLHDGVDIGFCDKCYYNHILEEKGIPPTKYEAKPKPTNAGRIRSMTDEELAEAFATACPEDTTANRCCQYFAKGSRGCHDCWLDWLKQEASE